MEIYNEELKDLGLGSVGAPATTHDVCITPRTFNKSSKPRIDIRDNRNKASGFSTEIVGLSESEFKSSKDLLRFFSRAGRHRTTTATMMNDHSSRSHEIFTVTIEQTCVQYSGRDSAPITQSQFSADGGFRQMKKITSRLHLVDLAGSERVKKSGVGGRELKEASSINSGLLTLGNVICALADRSDGKATRHIPYRDVKLTRVLQVLTCFFPQAESSSIDP
jgi:kinesin family protein 4/21/27